ncbi:Ribosomal S3, mitochondrial [Gossypium arboreum]|uniref:Ribosomal S3, mitochondrial n=1 Tax=Gossypium arboreum TaxID=29729 RepID=A0A0B0NM61_GOSAR|nr:Ribosomal S3, mitochondrial [Gossypium arboreum]
MYIPVPSHNNFILIFIVGIPNEPLGIACQIPRKPYTQGITYPLTGRLTPVSQNIATRCYLHKLSSNRNICQYTQPPVGRTGATLGSHSIKP